MEDPIERERQAEQMAKFHRLAMDGLVRIDPDREVWDPMLERTVVRKGQGVIPDHQKRRDYLRKLTPDMQRRLDSGIPEPRALDPLVSRIQDERVRKSAEELALNAWRLAGGSRVSPTSEQAFALRHLVEPRR